MLDPLSIPRYSTTTVPRAKLMTCQMSILRDISRAKSLLRAVGNITKTTVPSGQIVVKQGDLGDSMYTVVEVRYSRSYAAVPL